jgi:DNA-binding beta-propeller fold protein YncE
MIVIAGTALVFAVGFLFGRMLSQPPAAPTVHALPPAVPLSTLDVEGSAAYVLWSPSDRLTTIATHDLYSGEVEPRARFSPPGADPDGQTKVAALGSDLALVLGTGSSSYVAVAPAAGAPFGWVPGVDAAWDAPGSLLVRTTDGRVSRVSSRTRGPITELAGRWSLLIQTPTGAALRRGDDLVLVGGSGPGARIALPHGVRVLAVNSQFTKAVIADGSVSIWDGKTRTPLRLQGYRPVGAAFSGAGDKIAVSLRDSDGSLLVGVSDERGNVALKPLPAQSTDCAPAPVWDARGRWVYVAPGDGSIYAVEASGGRVEGVPTRLVGCGLAWFNS